jgi:hypothetical protein
MEPEFDIPIRSDVMSIAVQISHDLVSREQQRDPIAATLLHSTHAALNLRPIGSIDEARCQANALPFE